MGSTIIIILLYILSVVTVIKAARTGRGLFFPNFRRIDEIYFGGTKKVWNTWWGMLGYYLQFIFIVLPLIFGILLIISAIISYFFS